eukprot:NODE_3994_length_504_cov_249.221978_g3407_i0.p2 GENE.NODE_3994_length_504_cov_249.221978_g3407_i0~~NODE_3994_length_504_cov_249.221978_g3407_i0.p2  ORF type:complete len:94 (-),score=30.82 NODE_3994_length_504_cov_249.221978_g3407_i0:163-444(-)
MDYFFGYEPEEFTEYAFVQDPDGSNMGLNGKPLVFKPVKHKLNIHIVVPMKKKKAYKKATAKKLTEYDLWGYNYCKNPYHKGPVKGVSWPIDV